MQQFAPAVVQMPEAGLAVARLRFEFELTETLALPEYAGSLLRGVIGRALRRLACLTRLPDCRSCPANGHCAYPALFDPLPPAPGAGQVFSAVPPPYVLEPPPWHTTHLAAGEVHAFHLVLVGRALGRLPLWILAVERALADGLGRQRVPGRLLTVAECGAAADAPRVLWERRGGHQGAVPAPWQPRLDAGAGAVTLDFVSPLRLQDNGRILPPPELDPRRLVLALARRATLIFGLHAPQVPEIDAPQAAERAQTLAEHRELRVARWTRYSGRQRQTMDLPGAMGRWTLQGELAPLLPLLELGTLIHAGKNAAFGLGHYRLAIT